MLSVARWRRGLNVLGRCTCLVDVVKGKPQSEENEPSAIADRPPTRSTSLITWQDEVMCHSSPSSWLSQHASPYLNLNEIIRVIRMLQNFFVLRISPK